jgi:Eco57I restriction-modification methylase
MKLAEHVEKLRDLIEVAFDRNFARLGIGKTSPLPLEHVPIQEHRKRIRFDAMLDNHIGETGNYMSAREKLIDELTFTLFNRLAALKVMEGAKLFPPVVTKQPEHGDRSFGHKAWLEARPDMRTEELEGIREYIKHAFDNLGETLPLYSRSHAYALLPDAISLNEIIDGFNGIEKDPQAGEEIWLNDDVLGWMYESYNNKKKEEHKDSGEKTEYNKVSLQSQVYTPSWVVQFLIENSLGRLYLEMFPSSKIKVRYKIINPPQEPQRTPKPLPEVKVIDPACGSGNFLLYAFDFLYELYLDQIENFGADYDESNIPSMIIENNLHGIDLDDRAIQLAQLGLFIKAKKRRRTLGDVKFKVVSSDFFLPAYDDVKHIFGAGTELDLNQKELIADIWKELQFAYKFGSLIRLNEKLRSRIRTLQSKVDAGEYPLLASAIMEQEKRFVAKFLENLKTAVEQHAIASGNSFLTDKTRDAITFLELLTTEFDVAITNPPYTDSADFGPQLREFIEDNYKKPSKFHINLYAAFFKRCYDMTGEEGKVAMIHPHTFMFIKTFEDVRTFMLERTHVDVLVDFGLDRVNLFGPGILLDAAFYVVSKEKNETEQIGLYFDLTTNLQEKFKKGKFLEALADYVSGTANDRAYTLEQFKLKIIKSSPFIYWISDEFREKFKQNSVKDVLKNCAGLQTANNNRFLRFWWELSANSREFPDRSWVYYAKGGPYRKWSGNLWLMVNWKSNGKEIKNYTDADGKQKSAVRNESLYFVEGITYSASGSKGPSYRLLPPGCIFDVGGSSIFPINKYKKNAYILAFFNSQFSNYVVECLNPTVNKQVGDIERVPFVVPPRHLEQKVEQLSQVNINIMSTTAQYNLFESTFSVSPLEQYRKADWRNSLVEFLNRENHLLTQVLINEAIINDHIFEVYNLTEHDKSMVLAKEGKSVGGLPILPEAREAFLSEESEDYPLDNIREFIQSLPIQRITLEEQQAIEGGLSALYQNNNDLEEFCIRNHVNPINVWFWFKQNNVLPQQRMHTIAMEFIADIIREVLMEDEDGIIPLVPNAGEKILLDRIDEQFRKKGFTAAQYSSFDSILGRPLHEYLNRYFFSEFSDHLNLFMYLPKTPFIWQISSGPDQGFDCYVIIYKWTRDKLMRLRSVYIEHRERSLINRQSDLSDSESAEAQNEKDRIFKQLKEIDSLKTSIDALLAEGYNPQLEDGVGKNIAPLQKRKMIPYNVLNAEQLKKYLHADW